MKNTCPDEDIRLVDKYKNGDKRSLETLYNKYKVKLLRIIWYYVYDRQDAEDILQTLFLKLIKKIHKYKHYKDVKFRTWMYMVASNTAKDFLRKKRPTVNIETVENYIENKYEKVFKKVESMEMIKEVQKKVLLLPIKYREVISLIFFENFKYDEVASILNKPLGTIKSRANYAMNLLRKQFKVD
ncbi:MAG: RNA polymerase sigma factor [Spirochaetes bacterium]|nr:RNA polymerase sigma factor [Spirochaetota bacterium]